MKYQMLLGLTGLAAVHAHPQRRQPNNGAAALSKRGVDLSEYAMPGLGSYTKTSNVKPAEMRISSSDYVETATKLVKEKFPDLEFRVIDDAYVGGNGVGHVNFKQTVHGLDVDNGDFHVNVREGKVFSHGNSFFTGKLPSDSPLKKRDYSNPVDALRGAIKALGLPLKADNAIIEQSLIGSEHPEQYIISGAEGDVGKLETRLLWVSNGNDKDLQLSWRVETELEDNWLLTYVDAADTSRVVGVVDYDSDATYEVYPWGFNDPLDSDVERTVVEDPWLLEASPLGWHNDGISKYTTTRGNNGIAQVNPSGADGYLDRYRPESKDLAFEYPFSLNETDNTKYWDASITQLYYTANHLHDLLYVLGFNEEAGNFQISNNGNGGRGNDFVYLQSQDGSSTDNANFRTPPDGQNGRMRMYMFTSTVPERDSSFDAGVVIHEYVHGLSTRLTGGPANSNCLSSGEPGGMGEGWSDFFATAIRLKPGDTRATDYPMGDWVTGNPAGIRKYVYSTSLTTNPHTYAAVDGLTRVHDIGNIWASILYEVLWNLIDKHGKNDDAFPVLDEAGVPQDGKFLALKLVQEGMALQPCSPDLIAARDAIIDADEVLTGGDNFCELWAGFAKRGLGPDAARRPRTEDFELPEGC
ncbi:Fungalysin metallopeptidase-domain-containing protein [Emericellopsis atlantica]|uniref:Extracellular metalloproteinase n=1 Tax=Emericellopsis atlantica TaxID=2614577 RepID=A0A9P8CS16_9HYPO|nr:Fungalysin metallopeptidase-domain-containing protein [Emericellopsis atlantica]KAG9256725.1 Fungalysin metallopeptidase-domain-containing protein [Emericellopsis atlantica]